MNAHEAAEQRLRCELPLTYRRMFEAGLFSSDSGHCLRTAQPFCEGLYGVLSPEEAEAIIRRDLQFQALDQYFPSGLA